MDRAKILAENARLQEEIDTWKSVFPDIAPDRVLSDTPRGNWMRPTWTALIEALQAPSVQELIEPLPAPPEAEDK